RPRSLLDHDGVPQTDLRQHLADTVLRQLLDVERRGLPAEDDALRKQLDAQVADPPAGPLLDARGEGLLEALRRDEFHHDHLPCSAPTRRAARFAGSDAGFL